MKKKGQHTLTFKYQFQDLVYPDEAMVGEAMFKRRMMKSGYLYKNFKSETVVRLSCIGARANWPRAIREKRQKEINEMPEPKEFFITKPFKKN